jgi:hypothetical protein
MSLAPRIALTVAFALIGAVCGWRAIRGAACRTRNDRIDAATHLSMSASMVAMVWFRPWLPDWQMAVFAVAGGWFVVRAVQAGGTAAERLRRLHHGLVLAVMVGMLYRMMPAPMAVMAMPQSRSVPALAAGAGIYCLITSTLLAAGGFAALRHGFNRSGYAVRVTDDLGHAVMAAGMGAMLFVAAG